MTRDDPAAFAPPPAFGPFRVLHQIGIGALGPVFRTYEPTRDRLVAVKLFRLDITPEQAQALADELARACDAGLFHPSIVEPIAAGVEGTAAYRAEEYVAAESLDVAIRHYAPASIERALPFVTQLAGAIDFARTAGVGHGGLHLRDVFVTPEEARASGFGIVESLERVGIRAPVRRPYSAPERIAGAAWSTPADVFSLAAIAYELLTGRRPAGTGDEIGALAGEHIGAEAAVVHAVLARAMHEDPARRYSTALGFASALEEAAHRGSVAGAVTAPGAVAPDRPDEAVAPPAAVVDTVRVTHTTVGEAAEQAPTETRVDSVQEGRPGGAPTTGIAEPVSQPEPPAVPEPRLEPVLDAVAPIEIGQALFEEEPAPPGPPARAAAEDLPRSDAGSRGRTRQPVPTLFETSHEASAEAAAEAPLRAPEPPRWQYEPPAEDARSIDLEERLAEPARPRIAMLPVALGVILGLLIGFAGGYAIGGRDNGGVTPAPAASVGGAPAASPQASAATPPQRPGRAFSEQTVAQPATPPRTAPPPVPGDEPPAAGSGGRRPSTETAEGRGRASGAPAAAPAVRGTLTVQSTPKNAVVTVNGRWRGRTPVTIDDLTFGSHTVRVVQPGYAVAREVVTLTKAQPARTLTLQLQRPAAAARPEAQPRTARQAPPVRDKFSGSLYVASNPPGARVFIDGRAFGTAPARIPDVPIGSHVVRLELPDHRIWTTSTRVAAGQETRVTGSLERIQ